MKRLSQRLLFECDIIHFNTCVIAIKQQTDKQKTTKSRPVQRQNGLGVTLYKKIMHLTVYYASNTLTSFILSPCFTASMNSIPLVT